MTELKINDADGHLREEPPTRSALPLMVAGRS